MVTVPQEEVAGAQSGIFHSYFSSQLAVYKSLIDYVSVRWLSCDSILSGFNMNHSSTAK